LLTSGNPVNHISAVVPQLADRDFRHDNSVSRVIHLMAELDVPEMRELVTDAWLMVVPKRVGAEHLPRIRGTIMGSLADD
jgi:hypothetical protein